MKAAARAYAILLFRPQMIHVLNISMAEIHVIHAECCNTGEKLSLPSTIAIPTMKLPSEADCVDK
jgi:hypothetical protein